MSPEKQRIAILKACGWTNFYKATHKGAIQYGQPPNAHSNSWQAPDCLHDLNTMHEAEKVLSSEHFYEYYVQLSMKVNRPFIATAPQRCEAFLRTLGLWEKEANTTKSVSPTSPIAKQADHETAEEKVAWLTEILVTKANDPVFSDYWLRLARRNLLLGLPLMTPEPELNPATEESSATGSEPLPNGTTYTRSYQVFLPNPPQPQ